MNTHASPEARTPRRSVRAIAVIATVIAAGLALAACSSTPAPKTDAGAAPSATASAPAAASTAPATGGTPTTHAATATPSATPTVKVIVHYAVAATHTCSWKVGSDGNLAISVGFKITATGKNPPTNIPFEITDGQVTTRGYEPVGAPFQAVLDSGKPLSANSWIGRVITARVTVNAGQANAVHGSVTLNGPVKGVASGDTYCPAA